MATKKKPASVYTLKISLRGAKPPIWRRLEVPGEMTLATLHAAIQIAFEWGGYHLYEFTVADESYSDPSFELDVDSDRRVTLARVAARAPSRFEYLYDFGDSWEHEILVEKIGPPEEGVRYPRCIKGKRAAPPDDVGGVWGYEAMVEALGDPNHPEYESYMEWLGIEDAFDAERFDMEAINEALARL